MKQDAHPSARIETQEAADVQLVTPVIRGMRLLRYIAEGGTTANLSEVGRAIDVNRVTVMRLLATLEHEGLIERLAQGGHQLSVGFLTLAGRALQSHDLMTAGRRVVGHLRDSLDTSAYLVIPEDDHVVYLLREMPEEGLVSRIKVGSRVPAYQTAPGRAMLALLEEDERKRRVATLEISPVTPRSPASAQALLEQLSIDRKRGCAWSHSGFEAGINACAAAVTGIDGNPIAAVSVVGPEQLFQADEAFTENVQTKVIQAAGDLSAILAAVGRESAA